MFAGHRIEAVAGRGGMGVVYRARQSSLDRVVALKVIAPALMQDGAIRRRFLRESRVAASIDHPNVIPIYYTGEEDGVAYIAMRYVPGDDLRTLVRREGRLEPRRAAHIVAQVGAALDAAHAAGLVHRDVKPANVLLGEGDHAYLTDFGLTKHALSESGATRPGHWVGTLDFVAPEQIRGERIDARADVYGLGCLLHYALAGRPPFERDNDEAKLWAHLSEPPPRVERSPGRARRVLVPRARQVAGRALSSRRATSAARRWPPRAAMRSRRRERMVAVGAAAPVEVDTRTAASPGASRRRGRRPPAPPPGGRRAGGRGPRRRGRRDRAGAATRADGPRRRPRGRPRPRSTSVQLGGRLSTVAVAGGGSGPAPSCARTSTRSTRPPPAASARCGPRSGSGSPASSPSGDTLWAIVSRDRALVQLDARTGRRLGSRSRSPAAANALAVGRGVVWVAVGTEEPGRRPVLGIDAAHGDGARALRRDRGRPPARR